MLCTLFCVVLALLMFGNHVRRSSASVLFFVFHHRHHHRLLCDSPLLSCPFLLILHGLWLRVCGRRGGPDVSTDTHTHTHLPPPVLLFFPFTVSRWMYVSVNPLPLWLTRAADLHIRLDLSHMQGTATERDTNARTHTNAPECVSVGCMYTYYKLVRVRTPEKVQGAKREGEREGGKRAYVVHSRRENVPYRHTHAYIPIHHIYAPTRVRRDLIRFFAKTSKTEKEGPRDGDVKRRRLFVSLLPPPSSPLLSSPLCVRGCYQLRFSLSSPFPRRQSRGRVVCSFFVISLLVCLPLFIWISSGMRLCACVCVCLLPSDVSLSPLSRPPTPPSPPPSSRPPSPPPTHIHTPPRYLLPLSSPLWSYAAPHVCLYMYVLLNPAQQRGDVFLLLLLCCRL